MEKNQNPNHKEELKKSKQEEVEHCNFDNSKLNNQNLEENFVNIKNELIFY